jgi:hypothetical protein
MLRQIDWILTMFSFLLERRKYVCVGMGLRVVRGGGNEEDETPGGSLTTSSH